MPSFGSTQRLRTNQTATTPINSSKSMGHLRFIWQLQYMSSADLARLLRGRTGSPCARQAFWSRMRQSSPRSLRTSRVLRHRLLRQFGGLTLSLYLLFGVGSGLASACCPASPDASAALEASGCCKTLACHQAAAAPVSPCPTCAGHNPSHLRHASGNLVSVRPLRDPAAAAGAPALLQPRLLTLPLRQRLHPEALLPSFPRPALNILRSVVLLH